MTSRKITIIHTNIQGLGKKTNEVEIFLNELNTQASILCFSEHWLRSNEIEYTKLNGFKLAAYYCRSQMIRGGVCIYINHQLDFVTIPELEMFNTESLFECTAVKVTAIELVIMCIYRPPKGELKLFFEILYECLHKLFGNSKKLPKNIIVNGDFNIDLLKCNKDTQNLIEILSTFNLSQTIFVPTRITLNTSTCIDNIFTNVKYTTVDVLNNLISDHTSQLLCFEHDDQQIRQADNFYYKRHYGDNQINEFNWKLSRENWAEVKNQDDVNMMYDKFFEIYSHNFDITFPKTRTLSKKKVQNKWITPEIKELVNTKRQIFEQLKKSLGTQLENIQQEEYKRICKLTRGKVCLAKLKYNNKLIENSNNKNKTTWNLIKETANVNTSNDSNVKIIKVEDTCIENPHEIANKFNDYFINIAENLDLTPPKLDTNIERQHQTMFLYPCDSSEIYKKCVALKNKNSVSWDDIPTKVLKASAHTICEPLSKIINRCFEEGNFPDVLKTAIVIPAHKKGDKENLNNYRPISLLSNISKIFEVAIKSRLEEYMMKYQLISEQQHGFISGGSIEVAVFKTITKVLDAWNHKQLSIGLFFDLSKAFDCVNTTALIHKLEKYGIRGNALELLESYLSTRKQAVVIQSQNHRIESKYQVVKRGVPQGSVLGPYLFIIYLNDIVSIIKKDPILFADDISIVYTSEKSEDLKTEINESIAELSEWFRGNGLKLNVCKTQAIKFGNYEEKMHELQIIDNQLIKIEDCSKFLGIFVDKNLDWKKHIDYVSKRINKSIYLLRILKSKLPIDGLLQVYYSQVYAILRYGIIFWGNAGYADKILKCQKRCLRVMYSLKQQEHCRPYFNRHKLLTVYDIYILESSLFVKRNPKLFECKEYMRARTTRSTWEYKIQQTKLSTILKGPYNNMIRIYNKIPVEIRQIHDEHKFKLHFKQLLLERCNYSVSEFLDM